MAKQKSNGKSAKTRKKGVNKNKFGSIRKISNKVYVDFYYLDVRVRESSGLPWNDENVEKVRELLDKIHASIQMGTFRFSDVFPKSKHKQFFSEKESLEHNTGMTPEHVVFEVYANKWIDMLRNSGRITQRTLVSYNSN